MCYDETLKCRHSEPKAKNLAEDEILRSACGLPQDDGIRKGEKYQKNQIVTKFRRKKFTSAHLAGRCLSYRHSMSDLMEALIE